MGVPASVCTRFRAASRYTPRKFEIEPERSSSSSTSRPQRAGSGGLVLAATKEPLVADGAVGRAVDGCTTWLLLEIVTSPTYSRVGLVPVDPPPQATWVSVRQPVGAPPGAWRTR